MKATGMVRRIDDLGRIVIPKEVRRTLRISKGDPLELFVDVNGNIVFKKYSLIGELSKLVDSICVSLYKTVNLPTVICNKENVIAVCGISKKEYLGRRVCNFALDALPQNKAYIAEKNADPIQPIEGLNKEAAFILPVFVQGELIGYLFALKNQPSESPTVPEIQILSNFIISFLCNFLE